MMNRTCSMIRIPLVVAVSGASAQESWIAHSRSEGEGVTAEFLSIDNSTCELGLETRVNVHASQGLTCVDNDPIALPSIATIVVDRGTGSRRTALGAHRVSSRAGVLHSPA